MMIKIICLGKIKEDYLIKGIEEYKKRISKYQNIEIYELQDENTSDKKVTLKKEKERILKIINPKDYIITLEIEGKELTSEEFAKKIDEIFIINSNITFIIGGSFGLDDEIKNLSKMKLSFSKMTFPHQLFRLVLLEQIYRAFKINNNEEYHK
ncbi:MAG: 23S rRNA (pseudouridine(1915)-N(3))-methyltransferase RlmH [Bacilli bacterium]|nr:23S rRNA (pseudouridine(1915)-N(3))-methyltransferase RlmH [Bacilli bacterium]